jgi:hypothetical protein
LFGGSAAENNKGIITAARDQTQRKTLKWTQAFKGCDEVEIIY